MATPIMLGILLLFSLIFIITQIFVLRCKNIRLGLILPFAWFAVTVILMAASLGNSNISDGEVLTYVFQFLAINIPTGIMFLMMLIKNGKNKQKHQEENISKIKDLD